MLLVGWVRVVGASVGGIYCKRTTRMIRIAVSYQVPGTVRVGTSAYAKLSTPVETISRRFIAVTHARDAWCTHSVLVSVLATGGLRQLQNVWTTHAYVVAQILYPGVISGKGAFMSP